MMVTVNGNSPAYNRMGELHFIDWNKEPIVTLCYVQTQLIKGIENLLCSHHSSGGEMRRPEMFLEIGNSIKTRARLYKGLTSDVLSRHNGHTYKPLIV